ncbi:MAG: hypothetical protein HY827_03725 [Actinobacteria bacterium]|nr:hypothetical protein [Actinomycetota bacterium]
MRRKESVIRGVFAITFVVLSAFGMINAPIAAGQQIELRSCHEGAIELAETSFGWNPYASDGPIRPIRACPRELGFDVVEPVRYGIGSKLQFDAGLQQISNIRLTVAAGETVAGLAYQIVSCERGVCLPLRRIAPRVAGDSEEQISMPHSGEIGILEVRATCEISECLPGRGLRFNNVELDVVDDQGPLTSVYRYPNLPWVKPSNVMLDITVRDPGVGLGRGGAYLDAQSNRFWDFYGCDESAAPVVFLPLRVHCDLGGKQSFTGLLDLRQAADGEHSVVFEAKDAAGNVAPPSVVKFKIDGTPPEAPANLTADALNADGWTRDDVTIIRWTNVAPTRDSESNAGIARVFVDWRPRSGQANDPPARQGGIGGPNGDWGGPYIIPGEGLWDLYFWVEDKAGNPSSKIKIAVGRDVDAPPSPQLDAVPWLNRSALQFGRYLTGTQPTGADIESGICGYSTSFDATPDAVPPPTANSRGLLAAVRLPADLPVGDSFAHLRAISCSGVASSVASVGVRVDDRPPFVRISESGRAGWMNRPTGVSISAADDRSGVNELHWRLGSESTVSSAGESAVVTFGEGRHRLRYWATDRAGNESDPETRDFYVDLTPPDGRFASIDFARPGHVVAAVTDSMSGIDTAQIQYRRIDIEGDDWHGLPTSATANPARESSLWLAADMPDSRLANGIYALRVLSSDRAGNSVAFDTNAEHEPMRMTLPLRERWSVTAGTSDVVPAVCARKRRDRRSQCVRARGGADAKTVRLVNFSNAVMLTGDLRGAAGEPRPGVPLKVFATVKGFPAEPLADVITDSDGRYELKLPRGPSRRLTVVYEGDDRTMAARANADLRVRSAATLSASTTAPSVGKRVFFTGRLAGGDRWLSDVGKLIELQFKNGDVWQPGIGSVWTLPGQNGRFSASYKFRAVRRRNARIKIRALIRHEAAWPFEDGVSNTLIVAIRH